MLAGFACLLTAAAVAQSAPKSNIQHVLLISVDGLHAIDVANYVAKNPQSALAELSGHGVTYTNARTPANSDSFPGLLALVTGGSPITTGLFYDVSYDRTIFAPTDVTCSHRPVGWSMTFDESIDLYDAHHVSQDRIDPNALPRHLVNGHCVPLFPHQALRTNTIFEVAREAKMHTAWADKHPAYDLVNGPSGEGVEDLYTPEITSVNGFDATASVVCTVRNDQLKVHGIINQIHGRRHDGSGGAGVDPAILGMKFQAVCGGQKLVRDNDVPMTDPSFCHNDPLSGHHGGYLDGDGTPTDVLAYGFNNNHAALPRMIAAFRGSG